MDMDVKWNIYAIAGANNLFRAQHILILCMP